MRKILVMGNGFVGTNIYNYFKEKGEDVTMVSILDFSFMDKKQVDDYFKGKHFDAVIHCANYGGSRATGYDVDAFKDVVDQNLLMWDNITANIPDDTVLIHFGSGAQYNKARDLVNVSEDDIGKVIPTDGYGYSKLEIHKRIQGHPNFYNLIIFGLYGKGEDYTFKFISNAIVKNLLKQPIVINQNVRFSYLFLDDILRLIDLTCNGHLPEHEFNVTPTESITLVEATNIINEISDFKSEVTIKNPGMNYEYTGSNKRLRRNFPDFKFTSYKDGIKKLYNYYKENLDSLNKEAVIEDKLIALCKTK